jgi:hypothetical protein
VSVNGRKLSPRALTRSARETVEELIGFEAETVTGLQRTDDGWEVTVDVCEVERIPSTADVLATYAVRLDENGDLTGYERVRRFERGRAEADR